MAERRREKAWNLSPYRVSGAEDRLIRLEDVKFQLNIFERGLHGLWPLIGGMPSGSGFVGGVGYVNGLEDEHPPVRGNAAQTVREQLSGQSMLTAARTELPGAEKYVSDRNLLLLAELYSQHADRHLPPIERQELRDRRHQTRLAAGVRPDALSNERLTVAQRIEREA